MTTQNRPIFSDGCKFRVSQLLIARGDGEIGRRVGCDGIDDWTRRNLNGGNDASLTERLRHQTDSEHRLFGLVQQLHMPIGVLFQTA
jgi:hypothetical protein